MKKILIAMAIVGIVFILLIRAFAADEPVTFMWEQNVADLPNLQGWNFYVGDQNGPPWTKFATVPYTSGQGPWTTDTTLTITGSPGTTVKKYFAATAVNKDGLESAFATGQPNATEVTKSFRIPWGVVTEPFNFTIKVIVK